MRPIDADALLEEAWDVDCRCGYVQVVDVGSIEEAPTIEAKPIVHAHWINYNDMFPCQCSNCHGFALSFDIDNYRKEIKSDFCPHCGAQMDEVVSDNNVGSKTEGVKIPVISMEDVPKLMEEKE